MKARLKSILFVGLICSLFLITSCGEKAVEVDSAPFDKAITTLLAGEHMDMKINKFKDLTIDGDTAKATCSMKSTSGIGPAATWKFEFKKTGDTWKVSDFQY